MYQIEELNVNFLKKKTKKKKKKPFKFQNQKWVMNMRQNSATKDS